MATHSPRSQANDYAAPETLRQFWRGVRGELANTEPLSPAPAAQTRPWEAFQMPRVSRRSWLKLVGASAALAGGCEMRAERHIVPYAGSTPQWTPGLRVPYATSMELDGLATGLLVETQDGRPLKVEGHPQHPASQGASLPIHHGSLLQLYDPERARRGRAHGMAWSTAAQLRELAARESIEGLWLVTPPQSSPLVRWLFELIRTRHPGVRIASHAVLGRQRTYRGAELAFGEALETDVMMDRANVVVALDADFLSAPATALRWARAFGNRRRPQSPNDRMNRLYVAEGTPSSTGSLADHRFALATSEVGPLLMAIAAHIARGGRPVPGVPVQWLAPALDSLPPAARRWVNAVGNDLLANPGACALLVGDSQPPAVHALAHLMHRALGCLGTSVRMLACPIERPTEQLSPGQLAAAIDRDAVRSLMLLGVSPVYAAPATLDLEHALAKVPDSWHLSLYEDRTSGACKRFVPASHYMEAWGDGLAFDGTHTLVQPLIRPLHDSASLVEVLAALAGLPNLSSRELLQRAWAQSAASKDADFERFVSLGFVEGSSSAHRDPPHAPHPELPLQLDTLRSEAQGKEARPLELQLVASNTMHDGRFANVGWLQELPQPRTTLTWGNAALMSEITARESGIDDGDVVQLATPEGLMLELPALRVPGQPQGLISIATGYGEDALPGASAQAARGANAFSAWTDRSRGWLLGVALRRTGDHYALPRTQKFVGPESRDLALHRTLAEYRTDPGFAREQQQRPPSMLPLVSSDRGRWLMTIDTSACSGCGACMVACQAENNIPVVGPQGVRDHREMHWIRIDHYPADRAGDAPQEAPQVHQPMLCQHCEHAPCEYVCPVGATVHSDDGLNEMVYNRCVGTRFCSNNCPYKVRRFNWFDYNAVRDTRDLASNPDVTVRERGVMEKCTYCVQRIRRAEYKVRMEGREEIGPGEVQTACEQACPTQAIRFDQERHVHTEAVRWRSQPRFYRVLNDLGTRPRTGYLAKIRNPNPELG